MRHLPTTLLACVVAVLTGCATHSYGPRILDLDQVAEFGLPRSAAKRILSSQSHFVGLTAVNELAMQTKNFGDLLYARVSIAKLGGFESVYHTSYILHRDTDATDWSKATIYHITTPLVGEAHLLSTSWDEMQEFITEHDVLMEQLERKWELQQKAAR